MGKLVTFWSPYPGKARTTASMCAIIGAFGIQYPELELAVSHTKPGSMELEEMLDFRIGLLGKKELYEKSGIAALTLNYMQAVLTPEKIRRCAIPLLMKSIHMFPSVSRTGFSEELSYKIMSEHLVKEFSTVFLDLESGYTTSSLRLMQVADMIVVVLPQNPEYWENFCRETKKELEGKEICFVIGDYLLASGYSISYFGKQKNYRSKGKIIGAVPVNAGYRDAMIEGRTLEFFLKNQFVGKKEENYEFITQTKKAAEYIKKSIFDA